MLKLTINKKDVLYLVFLILQLFQFFIIGCSTSLKVYDITTPTPTPTLMPSPSPTPSPSSPPTSIIEDKYQHLSSVPGIPFRMLEPYILSLYKLNNNKYEEIKELPITELDLPNIHKLYAINFESGLFSNHVLDLSFHEDNTISALNLTTEVKIAEAVTALTEQIDKFTNAGLVFELERRKAKEQEEQTEEAKIKAQETKEVAWFNAILAVKQAERELSSIQDPLELANKKDTLLKLKVLANQASREAGKSIPYPNISPLD